MLVLTTFCFGFTQAYESIEPVAELPMENPPQPENEVNEDRYMVKFVTGRRGRAARRKLKGLGKIVASLPKDEVEVMILRTEEEVKMVEENPDVLRVERGMYDTWQRSHTPLTTFVTRILTFDLCPYRPQGLFDTNGRSPVRNRHGAGCSSPQQQCSESEGLCD